MRRVRIFYKKKQDLMLQAIAHSLGNKVKVIGQGAGLHLVLELTGGLKDKAGFIERAKQQGCRLLPFSDFYAEGRKEHNKLLLGFGGIPIDEIPAGIDLISGLLE